MLVVSGTGRFSRTCEHRQNRAVGLIGNFTTSGLTPAGHVILGAQSKRGEDQVAAGRSGVRHRAQQFHATARRTSRPAPCRRGDPSRMAVPCPARRRHLADRRISALRRPRAPPDSIPCRRRCAQVPADGEGFGRSVEVAWLQVGLSSLFRTRSWLRKRPKTFLICCTYVLRSPD